jgi:hypothetical protein
MNIREITDLEKTVWVEGLPNKNTVSTYLSKDVNDRDILISSLRDVQFVGDNLFYPNVMAHSNLDGQTYRIIREKTMSLGDIVYQGDIKLCEVSKVEGTPVFFFVYNTDNYFHFVYDTLPYLITYKKIKEFDVSVKLLMNYPNKQANKFYRFVSEFLELFGIVRDDILIINNNTQYSHVYSSSSYTHDNDSNKPPRNEIYELYNELVKKHKNHFTNNFGKKIYISRRTWLHNDLSNIGTNYTDRRRLGVEDSVVEYLESKGFVEIFTEKLTTLEKLDLFSNAEYIVGPIGGGLCNVLFSPKETKLLTLVSPTFLDVNYRFMHCLNQVDNALFNDTKHTEDGEFKNFIRIKCGDIVGEIYEVNESTVKINYTKEKVSGWNSQNNFDTIELEKGVCKKLDEGLNSCWTLDLESFKLSIQTLLS